MYLYFKVLMFLDWFPVLRHDIMPVHLQYKYLYWRIFVCRDSPIRSKIVVSPTSTIVSPYLSRLTSQIFCNENIKNRYDSWNNIPCFRQNFSWFWFRDMAGHFRSNILENMKEGRSFSYLGVVGGSSKIWIMTVGISLHIQGPVMPTYPIWV